MANIDNIVQILIDYEDSSRNFQPTISMVPSVLRNVSPKSFDPRLVSIGPLHHNDANVQAFEGQKASYMHDLVRRVKSPPKETLKACVEKVNASLRDIRKCYGWMEYHIYSDDALAKMMVMDGCFILEFMHYKFPARLVTPLISQSIEIDLLLVENQIPFFVLNHIFECTILKIQPTASLTNIICSFLKEDGYRRFVGDLMIDHVDKNTTCHDHILGLLHKCYQPANAPPSEFSTSTTIHSAVELDRAGVNFKPNINANWPMAMELEVPRFAAYCFPWIWLKPTLRMPTLYINKYTELRLRNLIAYEQSCDRVCNYVTSYVAAMDLLLDTQNDIAKLAQSRVIVNTIGSNEEATNMMNNLCKEVAFTQFFYGKQCKELDKYCNSYWPRNIAHLRRTYFSSPWSMIALLTGIVLFALTVVQTIFTIKSK